MGFIEDLRNQKVAEEQARMLKNENEKRVREQLDIAREEKRRLNESLWHENEQKIKEQVEQAGIRQLAQKVVDAHGASELNDYRYDLGFLHKSSSGDPTGGSFRYSAELVINIGAYVAIGVSLDGTVTFRGAKEKLEIDKGKWQKDKNALENALGKAYMRPLRYEHKPSSYTPDCGG